VFVDFSAMPTVRNFKKAWKREESKLSVKSPMKSKLSYDDMITHTTCATGRTDVKAAIRLGYACLARISELLGLFWEDVSVTGEAVRIFLRGSKTDPFRRGSYLVLSFKEWLVVLGILRIRAGSLPRSGKMFPSLTRAAVAAILGQTHSIRRGGAQRLFDVGFTLEVIKRRGRWASDAWKCYIDCSARDLLLLSDVA
jgi:integrase